ncbi:hypothetical protein [Rhodoflexus sp.]
MDYVTIDESKWPIVLITFNENEPTVEEFDRYLDQIYELYTRRQPVCFVLDATKSKYLSSELRIKQGNWVKQHKELIAEFQRCMIFVIPNMMVRFIFDAVLLVSPLPTPYLVVKSVEEGMAEAARIMRSSMTAP